MSTLIVSIVMSILGGGTIGVLGVKLLNRRVDNATAEQIKAEARRVAAEAAATEVENVRAVTQEYRRMYEMKNTEVAEVKADLKQVNMRLDKVEERERHMLTRAGVHEAWDQMALAFIVKHDPDFQQPPPLLLDQSLGLSTDENPEI